MSVLSSLFAMAADAAAAAAGSAAEAAGAAAGAPPVNPELLKFQELAASPYTTDGNFWFPEATSITADGSDWMYYAVLGLSVFCFVGILIATVYLVWKYRHRPGHKAEPSSSHNDLMEITWTIIPTVICVFLFVFGWREYIKLATPPKHALEVQVFGSQWQWLFVQPNGVKDKDVLFVPQDTPVRLVMTSTDVLHSFWVPNFRIKQDVVPRRYSFLWFQATKPGVYRMYCTEYCGLSHSLMKGKVVVLSSGDYQRYLALRYEKDGNMSPEDMGKKVFNERCSSCHTTDGTPKVGPSWKGLFGAEVKLDDGTMTTGDENYIRESILEPAKKARVGAAKGGMTSFAGILNEKEIAGVISYIKTLQ